MKVIEFYDGTEKEEGKEYKLSKRIFTKGIIYLFYESLEVDKEKGELKEKVDTLDAVVEELMVTILDLIPQY